MVGSGSKKKKGFCVCNMKHSMASECPYDFTIVLNKYHKEEFFKCLVPFDLSFAQSLIGSY
jgi:hypothetical protein